YSAVGSRGETQCKSPFNSPRAAHCLLSALIHSVIKDSRMLDRRIYRLSFVVNSLVLPSLLLACSSGESSESAQDDLPEMVEKGSDSTESGGSSSTENPSSGSGGTSASSGSAAATGGFSGGADGTMGEELQDSCFETAGDDECEKC